MLTKVTYNCEVIDQGNYVTSADVLLPSSVLVQTADYQFKIGKTFLKVIDFKQNEQKLHVVFQFNPALALLKFNADKFVNEPTYPNIKMIIRNQLKSRVVSDFKADPYLTKFDENIFQNDTGRLSYYEYERGDTSHKRPLVVFLHGSGERGSNDQLPLLGNDAPKTIYKYIASHTDGVLMVPQATWAKELNGWFRPEIRSVLLDLIKTTVQEQNIDTKRIYLLGLSNGGAATWHFAEKHPDLFAAIVPCCGYIYNDNKSFVEESGEGRYMKPLSEEAEQLKSMPIWAFHAIDDSTVNSKGTLETAEMVKQHGNPSVKTTIYKKGLVTPNPHASWELAYDNVDLLPWLFAQKK